ncbi:phosphopantetheine-binding protein [Kitasatospora purpeofusca]|uniref:phosphopantetheine-binding protein n=1 Tax=Kitasatospora purpeofusca TaxID=67352 RepID=UPI0032439A49
MSDAHTLRPWDGTFESLIREVIPDLPVGQELTWDLDLAAVGLNSLGVVELLMRIEEVYGLLIPDEYLGFDTFATPGSLWTVVGGLSDSPFD